MRHLVTGPPSDRSWRELCAHLDALEGEALAEAIASAKDPLSAWPAASRPAPDGWLAGLFEGSSDPRLALAGWATLEHTQAFGWDELPQLGGRGFQDGARQVTRRVADWIAPGFDPPETVLRANDEWHSAAGCGGGFVEEVRGDDRAGLSFYDTLTEHPSNDSAEGGWTAYGLPEGCSVYLGRYERGFARMTLRVSGPTPAVLEVALAWGRLAREGREVTEASIAEALLDARAAQATARAPAVETTPSPAPGPRPFGEEVTLPERPGVPTLEALRIGSDVLLRPTGAPWTRLAAHHERMGARLRVVLRSEIDPLEPRDRARVRWIEPSGPWEDADFVGRWSIQGSIPNAGGAIGWSREYALAADGTYQFSAYPARTADGRWRRVEGAAPRLLLDGAAETEVVGLIRDEQREPRTAGPLANGAVSVTQSDQAPPPESLVPPLATGPTEPPQTLRLELTTDAEGAVELPLEPWAVHVEVYDGAGRRVRFEL